jgi:hypothetical protein
MRRYRNRNGIRGKAITAAGAVLLFVASGIAHGSAAVLVEQPYGKLNVVYPAGHSAIYLDHVCAETPLVLRPCRPDELGVVISRYNDVGGFDWVAVPLIPYLYGVRTVGEIPRSMDRATEDELRGAYRRQYLEAVAPDLSNGSAPGGNWYELVGAAYDRTIYGFRVVTTAEQDARLIAQFNDRKNVERYNGMFRNCADFARDTINSLYPHAVHRNYVADLGMTSPKSVARSLSHHAAKHPEMGLEMFVIPQVKGSLPRSHSNVSFAEGVVKRYGVPLGVFSPVSLGVALVAYVGQGRFAMPKDAPELDVNLPDAGAADSGGMPSADLGEPVSIARPFPASVPALPAPTMRPAAVGVVGTMASPRPADVGAKVQVTVVRVALKQ